MGVAEDVQLDTSMTLSVVVPAYNEEDTIGDCLRLLLEQSDHIAEVVVVDNNSTDRTVEVVESFIAEHPIVRVLPESQQGLVYARNAGMDSATGDLIARIDADTRVPPGWAKTIVDFFSSDTSGEWSALCGHGAAYGLPFEGWKQRQQERFATVAARLPVRLHRDGAVSDEPRSSPVLYGSNMVVRRDVWAIIRTRVSMRRDIFEDVDMGLCVRDIGCKNAFLGSITVGVSPRRMETGMASFVQYMSFLPRTLLMHRRFGLATLMLVGYLPPLFVVHGLRLILIRAYDPHSSTFGVRNLFRSREERILP